MQYQVLGEVMQNDVSLQGPPKAIVLGSEICSVLESSFAVADASLDSPIPVS